MDIFSGLYLGFILFFIMSWVFIALCIYFTPLAIAYIRRHKNKTAIIILNTLLGWTFFGWLAALLWSLNSDVETICEEN